MKGRTYFITSNWGNWTDDGNICPNRGFYIKNHLYEEDDGNAELEENKLILSVYS